MVVKKDPSRLKKLEKEDEDDIFDKMSEDILEDGEEKKEDMRVEEDEEPSTIEDAHIKKLRIQETKDISLLRKLAAEAKKDESKSMEKYTKLKAKAEKLIAKAEKEKEKAESYAEKIEALKEKVDMDREMAKIEEGAKSAKLKARAEKNEAKRRAIIAKSDNHKAKAENLREKAMKFKEEAAKYYEKAKLYERVYEEYTLRADRLEGKTTESLSKNGEVKTKKRL